MAEPVVKGVPWGGGGGEPWEGRPLGGPGTEAFRDGPEHSFCGGNPVPGSAEAARLPVPSQFVVLGLECTPPPLPLYKPVSWCQ